jgi:hypothetical protein
MAKPKTKKRVANALRKAKARPVKRKTEVLTQELMTRYREYFDQGVSKERIARVVESAGAQKLRVDILSAPKPPRVVLPGRGTKNGVSKLDSKLANEICDSLQRGASLSLTSSWVGVSPQQLAEWLKKAGEPYETFQGAVKASLAYAEMNMINAITIGSYADPHVALKWLTMRYPKKYQLNPPTAGLSVTLNLGEVLEQALAERRPGIERRRATALGKVVEAEALPPAPDAPPAEEPKV